MSDCELEMLFLWVDFMYYVICTETDLQKKKKKGTDVEL